MRARAAAICAGLALLVFAAVALAATPSTGLHKGTSSQDGKVDVKVGSDHKIRRFRIDWSAPCDSGKVWESGTTVKHPGHQPGDGSFSSDGKYSDPDAHGGFRGHYKYGVSGKFTKANKANELIASGEIRPVLWRVMGFDGVAEAHQLMKENKHLGKIAILVGAPEAGQGKTEDGPGAIYAEVGA